MHTDPRILTGKKGASSLTQWYDSDLTGDHHSFSSCTEISSVSDSLIELLWFYWYLVRFLDFSP